MLEVSQSKTKKPRRILTIVNPSFPGVLCFERTVIKTLEHSLYSIFPSHTLIPQLFSHARLELSLSHLEMMMIDNYSLCKDWSKRILIHS